MFSPVDIHGPEAAKAFIAFPGPHLPFSCSTIGLRVTLHHNLTLTSRLGLLWLLDHVPSPGVVHHRDARTSSRTALHARGINPQGECLSIIRGYRYAIGAGSVRPWR